MMNISICPQRRKRIMNHESYYYSECYFNELGLTTALSVRHSCPLSMQSCRILHEDEEDSLGQAQNYLFTRDCSNTSNICNRDTQSFQISFCETLSLTCHHFIV